MTVELGSELPKKKKAVVGKTKPDAKPVASGLGSGVEALLERLVAVIQGLRQEVRTGFWEFQMEVKEIQRTGRWRVPGDLSRGGKVYDSGGVDDVCTGGNEYLDMVCGYRVRGG